MIGVELSDVIGVLESAKTQIIALGVILVLALIIVIGCCKMASHKKYMIRCQAGVACLLAVVAVLNSVVFGPAYTLLSLVNGYGTITDESTQEATSLVEEIADEGIVLLENDGILPLDSNNKLNVFGWASTNPCYGGTGSGSLNDLYPTTSLYEGLQNAGFELNTELYDFYTAYRADRPVVGLIDRDWSLPEPPASTYTNDMLNNAKAFSDTALVVLTRVGGENADIPHDMAAVIDGSWSDGTLTRNGTYVNNSTEYSDFEEGEHYLELSKSEADMIDLVCNNFDNVIVLCNSANTMELGFINDYEQIKGAIWCPGVGQNGFNSLGRILKGDVNPSGKLPDTFVYDLTKAPYYNNIGSFAYDNMDEFTVGADVVGTWYPDGLIPHFVNYVEGIYVGYRFYETAAAEGMLDYDSMVQYPFGYGLSYTSFTQKMSDLKVENGTIQFDVEVTNTGDRAGKDVVEVYYNPPYTNGGIEKSTANLVAYDKTSLLEPGESETITISMKEEDMASFDSKGEGCYVLEKGEYGISINSDSHNVLDSRIYTVENDIVYNENNPRSTDNTAAVVRFDDVEGDVTYLSRKDGFANYEEATAAPISYSMPEEYKAEFDNNRTYDVEAHNDPNDEMPVTGADNGIKLEELRGLDYNDAKWDKLLDEMTIDEMVDLVALGGYQTAAIDSIGKLSTFDYDGPAAINNTFTGVGSVGFPSGVVIAATWNDDLSEKFGESIGKMGNEMNVSGWYAPATNTHRSAFGGRNFEYYSEDGFLAGNMCAKAVQGAEKYGVYAYVKHFALNEQELERCGMLCTWASEQSMREIYLKSFEISVKDGHAKGMMAGLNYIGTRWVGGSKALMTDVLRNEWGFEGMVVTDAFGRQGRGYQDADQCIRSGTDLCLLNYDGVDNYVSDKESATAVKSLRQACKNIMYVVVNSRAYEPENMHPGMPTWEMMVYAADAALVAIMVVLEVTVIRKGYKKRKTKNEKIVTD